MHTVHNSMNFRNTAWQRELSLPTAILSCTNLSLGSGSYGGVCKAKCDGLLCAAKIMHPTLFDLHDPGTDSYLRKFQEECRLLSLARHPNVVQYLATYNDPDTRLPVLLVELCNQSLTTFLEQSPRTTVLPHSDQHLPRHSTGSGSWTSSPLV